MCVCSQEQLSVFLSRAVRTGSEADQLRRAEWRRDTIITRDLWRKVALAVVGIIWNSLSTV